MRSGTGRHRRPRQAPAIVVAAGVTGASIALPLMGATSANAADTATWDRVAECESGGMWSANEGNGFYGGLQLTLDMWKSHGGIDYAPRPDLASRSQQIAVAQNILKAQGPSAWPGCAVNAGLTQGGGAPEVDPGRTLPLEPDPIPSETPDRPSGETDKEKDRGEEADRDADKDAGKDADRDADKGEDRGEGADRGEDADRGTDQGSDRGEDPRGDDDREGPADPVDPQAPDGDSDDSRGDSRDPRGSDGSDGSSDTGRPGESDEADRGTPGGRDGETGTGVDGDPATDSREGTGRHRGQPDTRGPEDGEQRSGRHASRDGLEGRDGSTGPGDYTVRPGDNLSAIAEENKVPGGWPALYDANERVVGEDPDVIQPGQQLVLDAEKAPESGADQDAPEASKAQK
ncbi:transglycosylase domain-containing protein [Streptomyces sp. SAJ15]|nr:transglycosylase domain-containing protein [Streptomyces sp. SAJ15]